MSPSPSQMLIPIILFSMRNISSISVTLLEDTENYKYFNNLLLGVINDFGISNMATYYYTSTSTEDYFVTQTDNILRTLPNGGVIFNALSPSLTIRFFDNLDRLFKDSGHDINYLATQFPVITFRTFEVKNAKKIFHGHYLLGQINERKDIVTNQVEKEINSILGKGNLNQMNVMTYAVLKILLNIYKNNQITSTVKLRQYFYTHEPYSTPLGNIILFSDNQFVQQYSFKKFIYNQAADRVILIDLSPITTFWPGEPWKQKINSEEVAVCDWSIPAGNSIISYRKKIKVVLLGSLTGLYKTIGLDIVSTGYATIVGMNLEGGINGCYINIFVRDDKGEVEHSVALFEELYSNGFRYFFGTNL